MRCLCATLVLAVAIVLALAAAPPLSATYPGRNGLIAYTAVVGTTETGPNATDIFTVDPTTGVIRQLTLTGTDSEPSWSADGRRIAFASTRNGSDAEIYVMNADGSDQTRLTFDPAQDRDPAWSPDGHIVFSSNRAGSYHLFTMNGDGTNVSQLTFGARNDREPDWSPDGNRIVFESDQGSISDAWLLDVTTGERHLLADDPDGIWNPKWGPDGSKITFGYGVQFQPHRLEWIDPDTRDFGYLSGEDGAFSPDGTTYTYTLWGGEIFVEGSATFLAIGYDPDWGAQPPPPQLPTNSSVPTVAGLPKPGQTLIAAHGTWSGTAAIAYAYQWETCDRNGDSCVADRGQTTDAYLVSPENAGSTVRVVVTASNVVGSASAASAPTAPVPVPCVVPRLNGKTLVQAQRMLRRARCALGHVSRARSRLRPGLIASQRPRAGASKPEGTPVRVVVSRGGKR